MTDVHSKRIRSYIMSQIKGKNTKPEILVRKFLHSQGVRFKIHDKNLPGKPDIVLPKYKTVIEIQGCFWHGHDCTKGSIPKSNRKFWETKLTRNIERDRENRRDLENMGWRVVTVWECELRDIEYFTNRLESTLKEVDF